MEGGGKETKDHVAKTNQNDYCNMKKTVKWLRKIYESNITERTK